MYFKRLKRGGAKKQKLKKILETAKNMGVKVVTLQSEP